MNNLNQKIGIACILIFAITFCVWFYYTQKKSLYSLKKNQEFIEAVIWDISAGPKGSSFMRYDFFVKEKRYEGSSNYRDENRRFSMGDTCVVIYDKTNPNNNMVATRFFDQWLIP